MRPDCASSPPPGRTGTTDVHDVGLAASVFIWILVCGSFASGGDGITVAGTAIALVLCAPLVVRRRWPYGVLVATTLAVLPAMVVLDGASGTAALAPVVALYTVATCRPTRMAILAAGKLVVVALIATAIFSAEPFLSWETLKTVGLVIVPVAVGLSMRDRRLAIEAMRERAERAEATREEEARRRVGEERLRIAREVHDVVAHALVAINVQAGVAAHLSERRPEAGPEALGEIKRVSGEALGDLRATLGVLREDDAPAPTLPTPGLAAVGGLADRVRAAGIAVDLDVRSTSRSVPAGVGTAGYRIVQEALTNVLRHARDATRVAVRIDAEGDAVAIEVTDDGAGAVPPRDAGSGNGLRGMRERAAAIGGEFDAGRHDGPGWRVRARLPLPVGDTAA